jgi:hypothetical protein
MSEREYVEILLARAGEYIEWIGQERHPVNFDDTVARRWEITKQKLSAHTMRDLCKAWLECNPKKK